MRRVFGQILWFGRLHSQNDVCYKMVNNKVVDNLFIYLVLKFEGNRPKGLGVIAV